MSENNNEKYILLNEKNIWLRIKYSDNNNSPIKELKIAEHDYESK